MTSTSADRPKHLLAFLPLALGFLVLCGLYQGFVLDDSFISYRYAKHLALGHGLVFNIGEDPVEGYTSILWVLLNAAAIKVSIDPLIFSRVCSVLAGLTVIGLLYRRTARTHVGLSVVVASAVALSPPLAFLAMQGMDTIATALLLFVVAWMSLRVVSNPTPRDIGLMYCVAFVSCLARPDAAPFLVGIFVGCFGGALARQDRRAVKSFVIGGAAFFLVSGAFIAWRLDYFGYLFPNTYYIKAGNSTVLFTKRGIQYAISFGRDVTLPYLALAALCLSTRRARDQLIEVMPILLGCALFGAYLATIIPIQGFLWRFAMPVYPALLLALSVLASGWVAERPSNRGSTIAWSLLIVTLAVWNLRQLPKTYYEMEYRNSESRIAIGTALAGTSGTMFTGPAGAPPYFSSWRALDKLGLTSEEIAHRGLTRAMLERLEPDLMVLRSDASGVYDNERSGTRVINRYLVKQGFVAIAAIHVSFDAYLHLFARRDSILFEEMVSRLKNIDDVKYGDLRSLMKLRSVPIHHPAMDRLGS